MISLFRELITLRLARTDACVSLLLMLRELRSLDYTGLFSAFVDMLHKDEYSYPTRSFWRYGLFRI